MSRAAYNIGIAGLGALGRDLALNIADHGYSVAAYDSNEMTLRELDLVVEGRSIEVANNVVELVRMLDPPRAVMILAPAGPHVDRLISALMPHLASGDLVIEAGNSYFKDTDARSRMLAERGIQLWRWHLRRRAGCSLRRRNNGWRFSLCV
jgi:6-phosphogluconate dehydrogenase